MNRQLGKTAALYYRVATKQPLELYLDNQMHQLLCYAHEQGLDSYILYADVGMNGISLDRPAFNALKADIEAGRIGKVVILNISRLMRDVLPAADFIEQAKARGVEIVSITEGVLTDSPCGDVTAADLAFLKRGRRA